MLGFEGPTLLGRMVDRLAWAAEVWGLQVRGTEDAKKARLA